MNFVGLLFSFRNRPVPAEPSFLQSIIGVLDASDDANVVGGDGFDAGDGQCGCIGCAFGQHAAHVSRFGHIAIDRISLIRYDLKACTPFSGISDDLLFRISPVIRQQHVDAHRCCLVGRKWREAGRSGGSIHPFFFKGRRICFQLHLSVCGFFVRSHRFRFVARRSRRRRLEVVRGAGAHQPDGDRQQDAYIILLNAHSLLLYLALPIIKLVIYFFC